MNLFPITHRLSCKIYESRVPRGNWKQIHLKHDASNFFQNPYMDDGHGRSINILLDLKIRNVQSKQNVELRSFGNSMFENMKNLAMQEFNDFFQWDFEPKIRSPGDSDNSVVVLEIDGSGVAHENYIDSEMFSGIEALLDTPHIIKEFHSILHPLTKIIQEHELKGKELT